MKEMINFFPIFANIPTKHKPSEMEVAPPHKLLSLLNTVYTVYIVYTAYTKTATNNLLK